MAVRRKSHPQPEMYGPAGSAGSVGLADVKQYESALAIGWSQLTSVPTTISGYGITDAYTKTETDALLDAKADVATTLAGYGITDAYTKTAVDALLAAIDYPVDSVFGRTGAVVATAADIGAGTFPSSGQYVIGGDSTLKIESTSTTLYPLSFRGYATGSAWTGGMEIVDASGNQYGSWAKASASDSNIYFQAYLGGMKYWARSGSIEFAPGGTTTKWTMDQTSFDLVAASGAMALLAASTTSKASLRIPHGSAPTSPVNGDIWTTTSGIFVRINGVTKGPLT